MPLFDTEMLSRSSVFPDDRALYYMLNQLYDTEPERFGSGDQRVAFVAALREAATRQDIDCPLADAFKQSGINPLHGLQILFVAPNQMVAEDSIIPLLRYASGYCIIPESMHVLSSNARDLAGGEKYDFVLTGNVISASHQPDDTMQACAMMLKQGGHAIHMMGYGQVKIINTPHTGRIISAIIDEPALHERIGQEWLGCIPPGRYYTNGATDAVLLRQIQEIPYAPQRTGHDRPPDVTVHGGNAMHEGQSGAVTRPTGQHVG